MATNKLWIIALLIALGIIFVMTFWKFILMTVIFGLIIFAVYKVYFEKPKNKNDA